MHRTDRIVSIIGGLCIVGALSLCALGPALDTYLAPPPAPPSIEMQAVLAVLRGTEFGYVECPFPTHLELDYTQYPLAHRIEGGIRWVPSRAAGHIKAVVQPTNREAELSKRVFELEAERRRLRKEADRLREQGEEHRAVARKARAMAKDIANVYDQFEDKPWYPLRWAWTGALEGHKGRCMLSAREDGERLRVRVLGLDGQPVVRAYVKGDPVRGPIRTDADGWAKVTYTAKPPAPIIAAHPSDLCLFGMKDAPESCLVGATSSLRAKNGELTIHLTIARNNRGRSISPPMVRSRKRDIKDADYRLDDAIDRAISDLDTPPEVRALLRAWR